MARDTRDTPTRQYLRLVDQLGEEMGKPLGWQSAVAGRLGVHRTTLLRLTKQQRRVTASLLDRAAVALGIDPAFFSTDDAGHYTRWRLQRAAGQQAWIESAGNPTRQAWIDAVHAARRLNSIALHATNATRSLGGGGRGRVEDEDEELSSALVDAIEHLRAIPLFEAYEAAQGQPKDPLLAALRLVAALSDSLVSVGSDLGVVGVIRVDNA